MAMVARGGHALEEQSAGRAGGAGLWHPVRTVVTGAFVLVPAHVFVVAGALVLVAGVAADRLPAGILAAIGAWSLKFVLGLVGVIAGVVGGLAGAAKRLVDGFEELLRDRVLSLAAKDDGRMFPAVATADARERYEGVLDQMIDEMLGRIRVPRFIRGLLRKGLEQSMVEEFLADCERRGVASIGVTEVRNWVIATGLPHALRPLRGQITVWRVIALGPPLLIAALLLLVSLIGTAVPALYITGVFCGILGFAILAAGLVGADTHRSPGRWRLGLSTVGATVALMPWVWSWMLAREAGTAWVVVISATLFGIVEGLRMAFVSADRP